MNEFKIKVGKLIIDKTPPRVNIEEPMSKEEGKPEIKRYYIKAEAGFPPEMVEDKLGAYCDWREVDKELSELKSKLSEAKALLYEATNCIEDIDTEGLKDEIELFLKS